MKQGDNDYMLKGKRILLIVSGGIAAYKVLDLIRAIRKNNGEVQCILTKGGEEFVTPLSLASLSQNKVYRDLWSLNDEAEMGHIRLSRENDLIIVAPASADIIAKMAHGLANDLATTTLLASDKPVIIAPAMNQQMWSHPATKDNIKALQARGVIICGPETGEMACGEEGIGRMSEPDSLFTAITDFFFEKPLKGYKALVTSGPTYEPLDPVRFLGNRSSGKQGHAIAKALRDAGAQVTLASGPTNIPNPTDIRTINTETAKDMLKACDSSLPVDIAICAAAVCDWTPKRVQGNKMKKSSKEDTLSIQCTQTPDILKYISSHPKHRPSLVIGFAAETERTEHYAKEKLKSKGCDWIIANSVGKDDMGAEKTFGSDENQIHFISHDKNEKWSRARKDIIAQKLVTKIIEAMD